MRLPPGDLVEQFPVYQGDDTIPLRSRFAVLRKNARPKMRPVKSGGVAVDWPDSDILPILNLGPVGSRALNNSC
jgi:hypothetical protein